MLFFHALISATLASNLGVPVASVQKTTLRRILASGEVEKIDLKKYI
jgi:hypothetical protein